MFEPIKSNTNPAAKIDPRELQQTNKAQTKSAKIPVSDNSIVDETGKQTPSAAKASLPQPKPMDQSACQKAQGELNDVKSNSSTSNIPLWMLGMIAMLSAADTESTVQTKLNEQDVQINNSAYQEGLQSAKNIEAGAKDEAKGLMAKGIADMVGGFLGIIGGAKGGNFSAAGMAWGGASQMAGGTGESIQAGYNLAAAGKNYQGAVDQYASQTLQSFGNSIASIGGNLGQSLSSIDQNAAGMSSSAFQMGMKI